MFERLIRYFSLVLTLSTVGTATMACMSGNIIALSSPLEEKTKKLGAIYAKESGARQPSILRVIYNLHSCWLKKQYTPQFV